MSVAVEAMPSPAHFGEATYAVTNGRIGPLLFHYGLDEVDILPAWDAGYGQHALPDGTPNPLAMTRGDYKVMCLANILALEETHPGGAEMLNRLYCTANFGRAPLDMLRYQCDSRGRPAARTITALCASLDPTGAFVAALHTINRMRQTLPSDTELVLVEIAHLSHIAYAEHRIAEHGRDTASDITYFVGHGKQRGTLFGFVSWGRGGSDVMLDESTLSSHFAPFLKRTTHPDSSNVFLSCRTASGKRSIAEQTCLRTGQTTLGPYKDVFAANLAVIPQDNVLSPEVNYRCVFPLSPKKWGSRPTKTRVFRTAP